MKRNVHYPTDINLLYNAMRKIITLTGRWCELKQVSDWRQHQPWCYARLEVPDCCADGRLLLRGGGVKLLLPSRSGHGGQNGQQASEVLATTRCSASINREVGM